MFADEENIKIHYYSEEFSGITFEIRYYMTDVFDRLTDEIGIENEMWEVFGYAKKSFCYIRKGETQWCYGMLLEYADKEETETILLRVTEVFSNVAFGMTSSTLIVTVVFIDSCESYPAIFATTSYL